MDMRNAGFLMIATGLLSVAGAAWVSGCGTTYDDCVSGKIGACKGIYTDTTGAGGSGGTGGSTATTGGGGTGGNPPVVCEGDPTMDPTLVDPSCGVFVRADAAVDGNGDPETPVKTLQAAIDKATATGKWVFACTAGEFKESVVIAKGVEVYGGFDCANAKQWAWKKDTKAKLTGAPNAITLTVTAAAKKVILDDLAITAAPSALAMKGGSSIAVVLDSVTANLNRCDITAGDATVGVDGEDASAAPPVTPMKMVENDGKAACSALGANPATGGVELTNDCGGGVSSIGGLGGGSTKSVGQPGLAGDSAPPTANPLGAPGLADQVCASGGRGGDGADGADGTLGPAAKGLGALDISLGWSGEIGKGGEPGSPGQGGGGGGGKKGGNTVCSGGAGAGPTGGSGGAGGCGGLPGGGGRAGGSSIALVSLNSTNAVVTLVECKLKAGKGGAGGRGGNAQPGGSGGAAGLGGLGGASGLPDACDGGKGGPGGAGGPGGGGAGGHSLAIAYVQVKPTSVKTALTPGSAGSAGIGGTVGNIMGLDGDPGMAPADGTLLFP
jgi:hypothetical protein